MTRECTTTSLAEIRDRAQRQLDEMLSGTYTMGETEQLREAQDLMRFGTTWKRYCVVDDEIQVEHINPRMVYQDDPAPERRLILNADGSLSTQAVKGRRVGLSFNVQLLREAITRADPQRPWVALPQIGRRTVGYLAVQLLLDTYVN